MNAFDDMRNAVAAASTTLRAADSVANSMAYMLRGRLRHVAEGRLLAALKKELAGYNIRTGVWR